MSSRATPVTKFRERWQQRDNVRDRGRKYRQNPIFFPRDRYNSRCRTSLSGGLLREASGIVITGRKVKVLENVPYAKNKLINEYMATWCDCSIDSFVIWFSSLIVFTC